MTNSIDEGPRDLPTFVSDRLSAISQRKTTAAIAADAGFRSPNMLSMIASGEAKLPLDQVEALARGLECDPAELMRLALRQVMSDRVLRLVLSAGAIDLQSKLDRLGTWMIALATNMRVALDGMDRTAAAVQTLAELVGNDFNRVDQLRIEIEKRGTALIGYGAPEPSAGATD